MTDVQHLLRAGREEPWAKRIYFAQLTEGGPVKIGCSERPEHRLDGLKQQTGQPLTLLGSVPGGTGTELEWHREFTEYREIGEWFRPHPVMLATIREALDADARYEQAHPKPPPPAAPTPYYDDGQIQLWCGDLRRIADHLPHLVCDVAIADPPYGVTSLEWDQWVPMWSLHTMARLKQHGSLWCFGTLRMFLDHADEFRPWRLAQDIIWEKHNGSNFAADRFKRVHEQITHWYPQTAKWEAVYKSPVTTPDATARVVRTKSRPPHTGYIDATPYVSVDGGPRLMRSVISARSCHGYAVHPTQKPIAILTPLIEYSCPPDGCVFDPFAGSGSTLVAAHMLGRRAIGVEVSEEHCAAAVKRLAQGVLPLEAV